MIYLEGNKRSREYPAAEKLRDIIGHSWPNVVDDPAYKIWIIVGAKCYGRQTKDIDILLLANFGNGLTYHPDCAFSNFGQRKLPSEVLVRNICAAIEVKSHSLDGVKFDGQRVQVYYSEWEDATDQNYRQAISVKHYIRDEGCKSPWVSNFIWLLNVPTEELPERLHNILGSNLTWEHFLNVMFLNDRSQIGSGRSKSHASVLASASSPDVIDNVADLFAGSLGRQEQETERAPSEPEPRRPVRGVTRKWEQAQAAEDERLRKAEAELLRNRKAWGLRNAEEEGNEEEEKNLPLANHLRLAEKEEQLRKATESQTWTEIAGRYLANKQYKEALEALSYAIQLTPDDSSFHSNRGYILIMLRRDQEALASSEEAIRLNPNNSHAFVNKGAALNGLERFPEALEAFSHAIQLTPNNGIIYRNIGYTLVRLEKFPEALDALNRATQFDPNDSPAFVNKGAALNGLGRHQEALKAYKRAEEIDPSI